MRGKRRIPYSSFHTGYKRNAMTPDELLYAVHVPLRFAQHRQYLRKVGTRRAMAISKVALAGTALLHGGVVSEIRLAAASLAPLPARLYRTEAVLHGRALGPLAIREAQEALMEEAKPIDDIRSTAAYRSRVAANLLGEFLNELLTAEARP
jgi:CO/xanthine dehydrogenase FAD-binding subunit